MSDLRGFFFQIIHSQCFGAASDRCRSLMKILEWFGGLCVRIYSKYDMEGFFSRAYIMKALEN
jgi:hypothetical protein